MSAFFPPRAHVLMLKASPLLTFYSSATLIRSPKSIRIIISFRPGNAYILIGFQYIFSFFAFFSFFFFIAKYFINVKNAGGAIIWSNK